MRNCKRALMAAAVMALCTMPASALAQSGAPEAPPTSSRMAVNGMRGASMILSTATVRRVQQKLNALGFGVGTATGTWDEATRAAVTRFQKARGLQPTGALNADTMRALHIGLGSVPAGRAG